MRFDDLRPCWGLPGVAVVARAALDSERGPADTWEEIVDSARRALVRPAGNEPGTLCCGTAGRLAAAVTLGVAPADLRGRRDLLAGQADRPRPAPRVPVDAWAPGLQYGVAGTLVGLAVSVEPAAAAAATLHDYRTPTADPRGER